jgi:hypothetical protein
MSPTSRPVLRGDQCQCPNCGLLFTSTNAFDRHRVSSPSSSPRRCKAEEELRAIGWTPNDFGFWRKAMPITTLNTIIKETNHAQSNR